MIVLCVSLAVSHSVIPMCDEYGIKTNGIIHVGSNDADEYQEYYKRFEGTIVYIEAIPQIADKVKAKLDSSKPHYVYQAVISDVDGENVRFNVASNSGGSSSFLGLGLHAKYYPKIKYVKHIDLITSRLDTLISKHHDLNEFNVLVVDTQGADLKVLQSSPSLLKHIELAFVEISTIRLYENGCTFDEITSYMKSQGFKLVKTLMQHEVWGDAVYIRG